jgi:NitT/TauT family transport system substrate-binding protein
MPCKGCIAVSAQIAAAVLVAAGAMLGVGFPWCGAAAAETIKIGSVKVAAFAPLFVAQEKGYFTAEGIPAEIVFFDAAQPVAVATASGAVDFGVTAMTAGFYNLAGQGALKLIAAGNREHPGFETQAFLVSNQAFEGGLKSLKDLAGHSFAVTGPGGPPVYVVGGILAQKYGFDFKTVRLVSLNTMPNINSALAGGQVDFTLTSLLGAMSDYVARKQVHLLSWVGDVAPWQFGAVLTASKTANDRRGVVEQFLRAYKKGVHTYYDAVTGPDGKRKDGPNTDDTVAIIAKYIDAPAAGVRQGLPYIDANARLDTEDVIHQVDWYKSQGLVKAEVEARSIIDGRYVTPLPN